MKADNGTGPLESWMASVEYSVLHWSSMVIPPPVIVTGSIGNPLAAAVLLRLPLAQDELSASRYASALLAVSTVKLFAEGALEWFAYVTSTSYVMHQADWICRLWKFRCRLK